MMLQCRACISRHYRSNYNAITSPALGGGMHCPSACSALYFVHFVAIFYALFVCGLLTFVLIFSDYTLAVKFGHDFLFPFT